MPEPKEDPDSALPDPGGVPPIDYPTDVDDGNVETEERQPEEESQEEASDSDGEEE